MTRTMSSRIRLALHLLVLAAAWIAGVYVCWVALASGWFSSR